MRCLVPVTGAPAPPCHCPPVCGAVPSRRWRRRSLGRRWQQAEAAGTDGQRPRPLQGPLRSPPPRCLRSLSAAGPGLSPPGLGGLSGLWETRAIAARWGPKTIQFSFFIPIFYPYILYPYILFSLLKKKNISSLFFSPHIFFSYPFFPLPPPPSFFVCPMCILSVARPFPLLETLSHSIVVIVASPDSSRLFSCRWLFLTGSSAG